MPAVAEVLRVEPIRFEWHPEVSVYASESFLKAVGDDYGWIGGIDQAGKLRCVLPYTVVRKALIRMARFRVETIVLGDEEMSVEEEKDFLNKAVAYLCSISVDLIIPATTNAIFRAYPEGAIAAPYGTYMMDLRQDREVLWGNLNSSHRRKVRVAMKEGVKIRCGLEFMEVAYELIRDTFGRSKMGFMDYEAFKRYLMGLGKYVRILVADYQGVTQGCLVVPFSLHSAYYVYGGSIPQPQTGATNLLHWEAMLIFRELGVQRYDFVGVRINPEKGSKQEGLMQFKQRFGGQLTQGYIWKYALHPLKFSLYSLAVRTLRGGDIVDQERSRLGHV